MQANAVEEPKRKPQTPRSAALRFTLCPRDVEAHNEIETFGIQRSQKFLGFDLLIV